MGESAKAIIGSIVRWLLQGLAASVIAKGILTEEQVQGLYLAIVSAIAALVWSVWQKVKSNRKLQAALTLPPQASEEDLRRAMRRSV